MNIRLLLLISAMIAVGCSRTKNDPASPPVAQDLDLAINTVATSTDRASVMAAYGTIFDGGKSAIDELRAHLADNRTIPGTFSTRSLNGGTVTMAEQSFWAIQDMIEPHNWKRLSASSYAVLTRNNVEQWLDQNRGKSIVGLKIEAASTSPARAKQDFENSGSAVSREMIQFYRRSLAELYAMN